MRSPHEDSRSRAAKARARAARRVVPEGGKALARLRLFEQARGLRQTEAPTARSGRAKSAAKSSPGEAYAEAFEALRSLESTAAAAAPAVPVQNAWRPLGPFSIPHGQTYGDGPRSRPSVAGRISALAVDPGNQNHILVGAAGGGVWESKSRGQRWAPRTDDQPAIAIGAIAFDPSNPSVAYAGTGEGDAFFQLGAGLLKSTDGGTTWSIHATGPFVGQGFYDIAVDPLNGNNLLAATTVGLFRSTDGGATWSRRRQAVTFDVSIHPSVPGDPNSTSEVLAGCEDGVFRSANGGQTWQKVTLPDDPGFFQRVEVCHAPSDGNVAYVFAADFGNAPYLWRRSAQGAGFTKQKLTPDAPDYEYSQAWYDWFAAVAPHNPDIVYLGGIEVYKGTRQPNGKWDWETISARSTGAGESIHPDQHAIAFSPAEPNTVYIGNDGGIYRSTDAGTTWTSLNKHLAITEFEYIAEHPDFDAWLIGGTQDNGTMRYEGEEVWFHVQDGDGGDCGANRNKPYTCFHSFYGMGMEKSNRGGSAETWTWIGPEPPASVGSLFYPPMEVNGDVVAQAGTSVYVSTNNGGQWKAVKLPAAAGVATALAIPSPDRIYVGTDSGNVYRLVRDGAGNKWKAPQKLKRPRAGYVSDILRDPVDSKRLWATYTTIGGGHVYRSDDRGQTWTDVSAGLPNIPINAIEIDPANPDTVWVAGDVGVYRSTNAGASWTAYTNLLPNALVKDLLFHEKTRLLRAATQSRGVWEIAVDQQQMPDVEAYLRDSVVDTARTFPSQSNVSNPFRRGERTHWWQCTDVKVDGPPFHTTAIDDVDFEVFEDDHGIAASGLIHQSPQRGKTVRVYVQVHNRGVQPAKDVAVKVFYAAAALTPPNLPAAFWTGFPANTVPAASPWQPVADHAVVPSVPAGRAEVVGFEWSVPASAPAQVSLLAIISPDNDPIATAELQVAKLVTEERRCGLKNATVVNPPPHAAPRVRAVPLAMWPADGARSYALTLDRQAKKLIRGIVLPKRLARSADGARLEPVRLDDEDKAALAAVLAATPDLAKELDRKTAYKPTGTEVVPAFELTDGGPEHMVVLVEPDPSPGSWSLLQRREDGEITGGFTLEAR